MGGNLRFALNTKPPAPRFGVAGVATVRIWINKTNNKQTSVPRHNELVNLTCKAICKQLDIPLPSKY